MRVFLKRMMSRLGNAFVSLGNDLIHNGEHRDHIHIHIQVNSELKKTFKELKRNNGEYLEKAFSAADRIIANNSVDSDFFNDYYVLKSEVELHNSYSVPAILSVFISFAVSTVYDFAKETEYPYINEIAGMLFGIFTVFIVWLIHRIMFSKTYNVIYPYILERMEEKIRDHRGSAEKQENGGGC